MHSWVCSGPGAVWEEIQADLSLQLNYMQNKPAEREMSFLSIAVILSLELKCVWHLPKSLFRKEAAEAGAKLLMYGKDQ